MGSRQMPDGTFGVPGSPMKRHYARRAKDYAVPRDLGK